MVRSGPDPDESPLRETSGTVSGHPDGRVRVVLADDHTLVRRALRGLVDGCRDMAVVGEAGTGAEAVEHARILQPEVLTIDIGMPDLNGLDAIPLIRAQAPGTGVVVVTGHYGPTDLRRALRFGASGYITKVDTPELLLLALRAVARGQHFLSPRVTHLAVEGCARHEGIALPLAGTARPPVR